MYFKLDQNQQLFFEGWQHLINQVLNQSRVNTQIEGQLSNLVTIQEYCEDSINNLEEKIEDLTKEVEEATDTGNSIISIITNLITVSENILEEVRRNNSRFRINTRRNPSNSRSEFTTETTRRRLESRN